MRLSNDQRGILKGSLAGLVGAAVLGGTAYVSLPASAFGVSALESLEQRIAFAIKADVFVLLWLAGCVRQVSGGRFRSEADIAGAAYAEPSAAIAVRRAVLQNSLEQTVLAIGAHLALSVLLRGRELMLIPVLVGLYLLGRIWFSFGYERGPSGRAGGMALTAAPTLAALLLAGVLMLLGR